MIGYCYKAMNNTYISIIYNIGMILALNNSNGKTDKFKIDGGMTMAEKIGESLNEEIVFKLISFSGDARSFIYEAFSLVMQGECEEAEKSLSEAEDSIIKAHNIQTELIQNEAKGKHIELNLLMVHAQDHLMNTLLAKELIKNMMYMQKEINELKNKVK